MNQEIERKFLVKGTPWAGIEGDDIQQGYISKGEATVRVRIRKGKGYLTIKGKTVGLSRPEYEYEIELKEAREMLHLFCGNQRIEKIRYIIPYKGFKWEVDVFKGLNEGLVVAEIELEAEEQQFEKPDWVGKEVSDDSRYRNSCLLKWPWPFEKSRKMIH